jgi:DNA-binding response OmpR family regulator
MGDLKLDPGTRRVMRGGEAVILTPREFSLLELLLRNQGRVVSRETILERVWGLHSDVSENTLEAFVRTLRLKVDTRDAKLIHTVRGVGCSLRRPEP